MAVVSADLASKDYGDIGVVVLDKVGNSVKAVPIFLGARGLRGAPVVADLAKELLKLAVDAKAGWILIDGPQGWRGNGSELVDCRYCERALSTQGKTGLPGTTKPANYLGFISFAIALFDELARKDCERLPSETLQRSGSVRTVESFPTSAWRSLGLRPLPGKSKTTAADVEDRLDRLKEIFDLTVDGSLSHDELQALVSGLAGLAIEAGNVSGLSFAGVAPFEEEGTWREGFIVNPTRTSVA